LTDVTPVSDVTYPADGFALFPDRSVVALRVNGELKDLATSVAETDAVEPVTIESPDGLAILRHSAAHVLAQAVQRIHPQANLGIGPPITDGFYYDFGVQQPFTPEDIKAIDKEMQRIVREGQRFVRRAVSDEEARLELAAEPFKLELIGLKGGSKEAAEGASVEVGAGELTIYDNVNRDGEVIWKDLCRGPHLPNTRMIGNGWSLTRIAAAYWRGSEKNPQLQRIYGTPGRPKTICAPISSDWRRPPSATTGASARNWTCSPSPRRSGRACRCGTRAAGSCVRRWNSTRCTATAPRGTPTCTPRTSRRGISSSSRTTW